MTAPQNEVKAAFSRKWRPAFSRAGSRALLGPTRPHSTLHTARLRGDEAFRANPGPHARPPPRHPGRGNCCREAGNGGSEACSQPWGSEDCLIVVNSKSIYL